MLNRPDVTYAWTDRSGGRVEVTPEWDPATDAAELRIKTPGDDHGAAVWLTPADLPGLVTALYAACGQPEPTLPPVP